MIDWISRLGKGRQARGEKRHHGKAHRAAARKSVKHVKFLPQGLHLCFKERHASSALSEVPCRKS
ncbi:MAG: hypothetical protein MUF74_14210 [Cypionkella sp.]|nr:hypothetical protein [Cypionkella sp.]